MSDHHEEESNPIAKVVGGIFMIAAPAAFLVMLGVAGFAFIAGARLPTPEEPTETVAQEGAATGEDAKGATTAAAAPAAAPIEPAIMELGKSKYATCAACHGMDAKGMKSGPIVMAPGLVGSELLLHKDGDVPTLIILKGILKEGNTYLQQMMPLATAFTDEEIAAVLTYSRNSFGNSAPAITTEEVAAARTKYADVTSTMGVKRAEIQKIVDAHK